MPLSINFRWAAPRIEAAQPLAEKQHLNENLMQVANAITSAKQRRAQAEQTERANRIADEERSRKQAAEDKREKTYAEAADLMRKRKTAIDGLKAQREQVVQQIQQLKNELGVQ